MPVASRGPGPSVLWSIPTLGVRGGSTLSLSSIDPDIDALHYVASFTHLPDAPPVQLKKANSAEGCIESDDAKLRNNATCCQ
jgi:hypothetical protein